MTRRKTIEELSLSFVVHDHRRYREAMYARTVKAREAHAERFKRAISELRQLAIKNMLPPSVPTPSTQQ